MISLTNTRKSFAKKRDEKGFTIVELLIVIVVIGILAALVITTYSGIQAKARNAKRQTDVQDLQTQVEAFFASNNYYPSLTDLNSSTWRATNMKSLDVGAMTDPSATGASVGVLVNSATPTKQYGYVVSNSGATCEAADTTCNQYSLYATLEAGGGTYTKSNLD